MSKRCRHLRVWDQKIATDKGEGPTFLQHLRGSSTSFASSKGGGSDFFSENSDFFNLFRTVFKEIRDFLGYFPHLRGGGGGGGGATFLNI